MKNIFPSFLYRVQNKDRHHNANKYYFFIHTNKGQKMLFTETAVRQALGRADEQPEDCIFGNVVDVKKAIEERDEFLREEAKVDAQNYLLRDSLNRFKIGFFLSVTVLPIGTFLLGMYFDKFVDFFAR
tara:strand:- start:916 stop:1299 length:384 start_codon:yes stop_codon:yes gene_type:complete